MGKLLLQQAFAEGLLLPIPLGRSSSRFLLLLLLLLLVSPPAVGCRNCRKYPPTHTPTPTHTPHTPENRFHLFSPELKRLQLCVFCLLPGIPPFSFRNAFLFIHLHFCPVLFKEKAVCTCQEQWLTLAYCMHVGDFLFASIILNLVIHSALTIMELTHLLFRTFHVTQTAYCDIKLINVPPKHYELITFI